VKQRKTQVKVGQFFRLPKPLLDRLKSESERTGRTKTKIVERALAAALGVKP